jgi:hypothetical protein
MDSKRNLKDKFLNLVQTLNVIDQIKSQNTLSAKNETIVNTVELKPEISLDIFTWKTYLKSSEVNEISNADKVISRGMSILENLIKYNFNDSNFSVNYIIKNKIPSMKSKLKNSIELFNYIFKSGLKSKGIVIENMQIFFSANHTEIDFATISSKKEVTQYIRSLNHLIQLLESKDKISFGLSATTIQTVQGQQLKLILKDNKANANKKISSTQNTITSNVERKRPQSEL